PQGRLLVGDLFLPGDVLRLAVVEHPPLTLELLLDPSRVLVPLLEPGLHRPQLDLLLPEFLLLREDLLFPFFQFANPGRVGSGRMGGLDLLPFQPEFRILQLQLLFLLQHRCTLRVERLLEFLEAGLAFLDRFDLRLRRTELGCELDRCPLDLFLPFRARVASAPVEWVASTCSPFSRSSESFSSSSFSFFSIDVRFESKDFSSSWRRASRSSIDLTFASDERSWDVSSIDVRLTSFSRS